MSKCQKKHPLAILSVCLFVCQWVADFFFVNGAFCCTYTRDNWCYSRMYLTEGALLIKYFTNRITVRYILRNMYINEESNPIESNLSQKESNTVYSNEPAPLDD